MITLSEIKPAIGRSISHNEIVRLAVHDPRAAFSLIDNDENVSELDWCDGTGADGDILDVWGKRLGEDFRLHIVKG